MILLLEIILYAMAALGGLTILLILTWFIYMFIKYMCRYPYNFAERYGKGSYVVITGATDTMGIAFAKYFASLEFRLVLVARNAEKLQRVVDELSSLNGWGDNKANFVITEKMDFRSERVFPKLLEKLEKLDVSVLINNVGTGFAGRFLDESEQSIRDSITVNTLAQSMLTNGLINQFNKRTTSDGKPLKSAIIDVGSFGALLPVPGQSTYMGTKAFSFQLSESIGEEQWERDQIDFLALLPHMVETHNTDPNTKSWYVITADSCVAASMKQLGKYTSTIGHWKHALYVLYFLILPRCCVRKSVFEQFSAEKGKAGKVDKEKEP